MKVFVVKYDSTEPYDPGTVEILGVYTERWKAVGRIQWAKLQKQPMRCVDWEATNSSSEYIKKRCMKNYVYTSIDRPVYSDRDDYFEIVEMELDA